MRLKTAAEAELPGGGPSIYETRNLLVV